MSVNARLHYGYGYEVGIGDVYGRAIYGSIGYGVIVVPGFPLFHTSNLSEIEELVTAVVDGTYGTSQYGAFVVRQAAAPTDAAGFSIRSDGTYSAEFVEDESIALRVSPDQTVAYEFSEVEWHD